MIWRLAAFLFCVSGPLAAAECRETTHDENRYALCEVNLAVEELRLFLLNKDGGIHGSFKSVNSDLAEDGLALGVAMNAGMYHEDRTPVGLYVENGEQAQRLITTDGPGNFGLLPNGVFCVGQNSASVVETRAFAKRPRKCIHASQSGPMLVIDGALHPRFLIDSTSHYIRNGVGISADGTKATFVISRNTVTFHQFGSFFRDVLKTPNALYFDGNVSRLYAPQINSFGTGWLLESLGPIIGTVVPAK